ncbi:MAG: hypothetical protein VX941_12660 [Pseudomonadota bacterium]|nr:hypothetical protein [Pseudomonadota bacterium]
MIIRRLILSIVIINFLTVLSASLRAEDGFVNSFLCEGNLTFPEHRIIKDARFEIMASGDGYRMNAMWLRRAFSGLGVARQNGNGRVAISFALLGHAGLSTVVGIIEQTKGPQGRTIVDSLTVAFTEVIKKEKYEVAVGHLMCEVSVLE